MTQSQPKPTSAQSPERRVPTAPTAGAAAPAATDFDQVAFDPLGPEEWIEQAHFFEVLAQRLEANIPTQEVLHSVREEVLATTKLPHAIDFLLAELKHAGVWGSAMARLSHYFTPFQAFIMAEAESEKSRFDLRIGLEILHREASYRAESATVQGLFLYQFEAICRNRLRYDRGMGAMACDPAYPGIWREWIEDVSRKVGMVDIADLIYVHSDYYTKRSRSGSVATGPAGGVVPTDGDAADARKVLFGEREGRIALANRRKDPMFLLASLHRQLRYPEVPQPTLPDETEALVPQLARRMELMEKRIKLLEEENRGGIDISKFYGPPDAQPGQS